MIKTVSFAPPRSARAAAKVASKSSSKPAAQPVRALESASGCATVAPKPAKMQPASTASATSSDSADISEAAPPRRRAASEKPATKVRSAEVASTETENSEAAKGVEIKVVSSEFVASAKKVPAKRAMLRSADVALDFSPETEPEAPLSATLAAIVAPRIKKSRAPKDLAAQYGAAPESAVVPRAIAEKNAPRKRLTRAAKEARSQMLRPDDDVLQRLQQANTVEVKRPANRGRGWEFECGRCGRISRFQTPAAICACGAIAVKE